MKKIFLMLIFLTCFTTLALAQNSFMSDILKTAKTIKIEGKVLQSSGFGPVKRFIILDCGGTKYKIYGIGPYKFWKLKRARLPQPGDNIEAVVYVLKINGKFYYIFKKIKTMNGKIILLRDNNGDPVWRKIFFKRRLKGRQGSL